jgi:hypothetical protein
MEEDDFDPSTASLEDLNDELILETALLESLGDNGADAGEFDPDREQAKDAYQASIRLLRLRIKAVRLWRAQKKRNPDIGSYNPMNSCCRDISLTCGINRTSCKFRSYL